MVLRSFLKIEDSEREKKRKSSNVSGAKTTKNMPTYLTNKFQFTLFGSGLIWLRYAYFYVTEKIPVFFVPHCTTQ